MDEALEGGGDRAGPWDRDRGDGGAKMPCCVVAGSVRWVGTLAQLQFDVLGGERDPLDMVVEQLPLAVGT